MNLAKRITPLVAFGGMIAGMGLMEREAHAETSSMKGTVTASVLNVRESGSTSSRVVGKLNNGAAVTILETSNGWYKITSENTTGWVSATYIEVTAKQGETTANLNVRSSNSTSSSILTTLPKGTSMTIVEGKEGWYRITSGNVKGWVSSNYIQLITEGTDSDSETVTKQGETTSNLNVRSNNSTSSSVLTILPKGTSLTIMEEKEGWYRITAGNVKGWVSATYVQLITNEDADSDLGTIIKRGGITANLNVRSSNSTSSSILTVLPIGTSITIMEEKDGWYRIALGDINGWVSANFVKLIATGSSINDGSDQWDIMSRYDIPSVAAGHQTKYTDIIVEVSEQHGVPITLIQKIIEAESNFQNNATSPAGAQGLMQLMPATAAGLGVTDPFDPAQNIEAGVRYISQHLNNYSGNLILALAAYNAGAGNVNKFGGVPPFTETINYIRKITGIDVSGGYPL